MSPINSLIWSAVTCMPCSFMLQFLLIISHVYGLHTFLNKDLRQSISVTVVLHNLKMFLWGELLWFSVAVDLQIHVIDKNL